MYITQSVYDTMYFRVTISDAFCKSLKRRVEHIITAFIWGIIHVFLVISSFFLLNSVTHICKDFLCFLKGQHIVVTMSFCPFFFLPCPGYNSETKKRIYFKLGLWVHLTGGLCIAQESLLCVIYFLSYAPLWYFLVWALTSKIEKLEAWNFVCK